MHRDFEQARRVDTGEVVTFTLNGEEYSAWPDAPGGLILDLAKASMDTEATNAAQVAAAAAFLEATLVPESAERFAAAMRDPANPITFDQAAAVMEWLLEEAYTARPTEPSSPSAVGPSTPGRPSTGRASRTASTPSASPPTGS